MRRARSRSFRPQRVDVDHQVAVGLSDQNHRRRGQHVQDQLGGGAGLERVEPAMISGPTAGAIVRSTNACSSLRGSQVTNTTREPALLALVSAPRTNGVMPLAETPPITTSLGRVEARDGARAFFVVVLGAFLGANDRVPAAGHDALDELGIGAERRRHLRGLDDAEAAARAGADEHDASAFSQGLGADVGAERDPVALFCTAASMRRSSAIIKSTMPPASSLSMAREAGLMASVGSACHLERGVATLSVSSLAPKVDASPGGHVRQIGC